MTSYVITGSTQGLGYAFLEVLAKNPSNVVIGVARNKAALEDKAKAAGLKINVVEGDVNSLASMKSAAEAAAKINGGRVDFLINNAGLVSHVAEWKSLVDFDSNFETLEADFLESFKVNTIGLLHTVQAFLPLVRNSAVKKVANISTGMADLDFINQYEVDNAGPYATSKAASNMVIGKYQAALRKEGILCLSVSPGYVQTERNDKAGGEDPKKVQEMSAKFSRYAPNFTRPLTPEESVTAMLKVIEQKSVAAGDGGSFISHKGNKKWL